MSHQYFYSYFYSALFDASVSEHTMLLRCLPYTSDFQHILQQHLILPPDFWQYQSFDSWGNTTVCCGNRTPHTSMIYESAGIVQLDDYEIKEQSPSPIYLFPTCLTDIMGCPIKNQSVESICEFVNQKLTYQKGITCNKTKAQEALDVGQGVCQDYAHVMIGICRQNGILARYVVGMIEGEGETHAWVEVWKDGKWIAFDPTNNIRISHGYIKIAHGRDAADCQVCRGTYYGVAKESPTIRIRVQQL